MRVKHLRVCNPFNAIFLKTHHVLGTREKESEAQISGQGVNFQRKKSKASTPFSLLSQGFFFAKFGLCYPYLTHGIYIRLVFFSSARNKLLHTTCSLYCFRFVKGVVIVFAIY